MYSTLAQKLQLTNFIYDRLGNNKLKVVLLHPLFLSGLALKLVFSLFFASTFLIDYFIPFANYFVQYLANPYTHFHAIGFDKAFPYPACMLYVLAVSKLFLGNVLPDMLIYRIPLLIADTSILLILARWLKTADVRRILWLYWLSPLSFYISYIHGQLDVIPVAMLCISIYCLFKERPRLAFGMLGLSIACKTSMVLAVPFFLVYLFFHAMPIREKLLSISICVLSFLVVNLPWFFSPDFIAMVFQNSEQQKLFNMQIQLKDVIFYVVPAVYSGLIFTAYSLKIQSRTMFIMFLGFAFGIILLFCNPMPGWCFWIFPFFCYFYITYTQKQEWLFFALQFAYLAYFYCQGSFNADANGVLNISFTLLQTLLLLNCYTIYKKGIWLYRLLPLTSKPYLIGIGGNSGVGKTTLSEALMQVFSANNTTIISGDDMHKWERGNLQWQQLTHLNPKANELHSEYSFLSRLKNGLSVHRRYYNHETGTFQKRSMIKPNKVTILEGLHPFYIENVRKLFNLRIFLKPDERVAVSWKMARDMNARGYTKEAILQQIESRKQDFNKYILPQEKHANMIIELVPMEESVEINPDAKMQLCLTIDNTIQIENLLQLLSAKTSLKISHEYIENDKQTFKMIGSVSEQELEEIAYISLPKLMEIGISKSIWKQGEIGLLQLIITYIILEQVDRDF